MAFSNCQFIVSVDVGLITFSFCVFNKDIPIFMGTADISAPNIQISLKKCCYLLDYLRAKFDISMVLVEHQLMSTKNIRIQHFINDYCILRTLEFKVVKAISFKQNLKTRHDRKMYSKALFEAKMIAKNIDIDYRDASIFDVCDAANIGLKFIEAQDNVHK